MKIIIIILTIVALLAITVFIIGYLLPVKHTVTVSADFIASKKKVWNVVFDVSKYPKWRSDVKKVDVNSTGRGWVEYGNDNESLTYEIVEAQEEKLLATQIQDKDKPFGGGWVITMQDSGNRTRVTITENGEVYNPIFRFVSKFIFGHTATANRYLADLENELKK